MTESLSLTGRDGGSINRRAVINYCFPACIMLRRRILEIGIGARLTSHLTFQWKTGTLDTTIAGRLVRHFTGATNVFEGFLAPRNRSGPRSRRFMR